MRSRRMQAMVALLALMLGATAVYADNGVERVMGTVMALTDSSVTVETVKHTAVTVLLDSSTKFTKTNARISLKDVKAGDQVVIDAKENGDRKLVGLVVRLGSAAHGPDHQDHPTHADRADHTRPADHHN